MSVRACTGLGMAVAFVLIASTTASAESCIEYGGSRTCPAPPPPGGGVNECDWECKDLRRKELAEWRKRKQEIAAAKAAEKRNRKQYETHGKLLDKANALVIKAKQAHAARKYDQQLEFLRQALAILPDDATLRLNVIQHLSFHGRNAMWRDQQLGDFRRYETYRSQAEELHRLLAGNLAKGIGYAEKKAEAESFLYDFEYTYRPAAESARRARQIAEEQNRAWGSGQGTIQTNPGARSSQGVAAANSPPPRLPPPRNVTALGQLQDILDGRVTVGEALQGGQSVTDPTRFARPVAPGAALSAAQRARLDASTEYRRSAQESAAAETEFSRAATELQGLKRVAAYARPGSANVPTAAELERAERKASEGARKLEKARTKEREVINRVVGEPIYREN